MRNSNSKLMVTVALVAAVIGAGSAVLAQRLLPANADSSVAVINLGALIRHAAGNGPVGEDAIDTGFKQMQQLGQAFSEKGFLVLDGSAVISAPDSYYVPGPPIPGNNRMGQSKKRVNQEQKQPEN